MTTVRAVPPPPHPTTGTVPELTRLFQGLHAEAIPYCHWKSNEHLGDSLVRATGAVYRRAWRQAVFAVLVIVGSLIGQRWGIAGVAGGAMFALSINFLLMAQLSVSMAEMPWRDFWGAHLPALLVAAASAPIAWAMATALRHQQLPPLVVLSGAGGLALAVALVLVWRFPRLFLGRDVRWMLDALRGMVPRLTGPATEPR
ncbi:MAG: hypothetical protein DMD70_02885 [Gemmatimonadetes bacterium]|nr:MAG: hypothetical protein DMD70_02885 [Gemmatimonadota bacterium]